MADATAIFHGVEVPETLLATELQHHRAGSMASARAMAGRALAARAVLLARAAELGVEATPERNEDGQEETPDEALIRMVLSEEVDVEPVMMQEAERFYTEDPDGFRSPPLIDASHILIAPTEETEAAAEEAHAKALALIADLTSSERDFARCARAVSDCPSGREGGSLGQLRPGDVVEEIWDALLTTDIGTISERPVRSRFGWHVLRVDQRADGAVLPFEHVFPHIAAQMEAQKWVKAAARFVDRLLADQAAKPSLRLDEGGALAQTGHSVKRADGLLGAALCEPAEALRSVSTEALERIEAAAAAEKSGPEDVLRDAINQYLQSADDEAWTQLISILRDSAEPLRDCLGHIVDRQLPSVRVRHTLIQMRSGKET